MVNCRSKGNRIQLMASKYLQKNYYVHMNGHKRFGQLNNYDNKKSQDIFGLWDGIIVHKTDGIVAFVQISANKFHAMAPYIEFCKKTKQIGFLICKKDRKEWIIRHIDETGTFQRYST